MREAKGGGGEGGFENAPRFVSISTTSSLLTKPSLSRSKIWNPSRISRTCDTGNRDSASPFATTIGLPIAVVVYGFFAAGIVVRVGESDGSSSSPCGREGVRPPRGVQLLEVEGGVAMLLLWSLEGDDDVRGVCCCFC